MLCLALAALGTYPVAVTIVQDGRTIGTPLVTLTEGKAATIEADRPGGYSLTLMVTPVEGSAPAAARIDSTLSLKRGGRWVVVAAPVMSLRVGGTATFEGGNAAAGGPVTIAYRIERPRP